MYGFNNCKFSFINVTKYLVIFVIVGMLILVVEENIFGKQCQKINYGQVFSFQNVILVQSYDFILLDFRGWIRSELKGIKRKRGKRMERIKRK